MLSQRLVKLQALRQWPGLSPAERREAQVLQQASVDRVTANLARLAEPAAPGAGGRAGRGVGRLERAGSRTGQPPARPGAQRRRRAGAAGPQRAVGGRAARARRPASVRLLAEATRLRLLSQRLAKEGLLSQVLPATTPAAWRRAWTSSSPLRTGACRAAGRPGAAAGFAAVDEPGCCCCAACAWSRAMRCSACTRAASGLLQALEDLIQALQRSLQLIWAALFLAGHKLPIAPIHPGAAMPPSPQPMEPPCSTTTNPMTTTWAWPTT